MRFGLANPKNNLDQPEVNSLVRDDHSRLRESIRYPELLEFDSPLVASSHTVPDEALREFGLPTTR